MPFILNLGFMAINSKDIEILWKQYSEDEVNKGISVAQFFESNGIPYHCFEKWYKKKYSKTGIVDCIVSGSPDGTVEVPEGGGLKPSNREMRKEVYVSYVNIGLSNGIKVEHSELAYPWSRTVRRW